MQSVKLPILAERTKLVPNLKEKKTYVRRIKNLDKNIKAWFKIKKNTSGYQI